MNGRVSDHLRFSGESQAAVRTRIRSYLAVYVQQMLLQRRRGTQNLLTQAALEHLLVGVTKNMRLQILQHRILLAAFRTSVSLLPVSQEMLLQIPFHAETSPANFTLQGLIAACTVKPNVMYSQISAGFEALIASGTLVSILGSVQAFVFMKIARDLIFSATDVTLIRATASVYGQMTVQML